MISDVVSQPVIYNTYMHRIHYLDYHVRKIIAIQQMWCALYQIPVLLNILSDISIDPQESRLKYAEHMPVELAGSDIECEKDTGPAGGIDVHYDCKCLL